MATSSLPVPWSFITRGKPKFSFPPASLTPAIISRIRIHHLSISQGDLTRPRDLPRTVEIQARALPPSHYATTAPGSRVWLWPSQMPGPCPLVGCGVDDDGKHARRVRVPSCNRCRRPPCSTRAGVYHTGRLVSSHFQSSYPPFSIASPAPRLDACRVFR